MVGILLTGHGQFPYGLKDSVEMIFGEIPQMEVVNLKPGDDPTDFGNRLDQAIDRLDTGKGVMVLTDIRGGTPFNQSLMRCQNKNIHILAGTNLPVLLVIGTERNENTSLAELSEKIKDIAADCVEVIAFEK